MSNLKERNIWDTAFKSGYNEAVKDNGKKVTELKKRGFIGYAEGKGFKEKKFHRQRIYGLTESDFNEVFGKVKS